jgi:ribosomal protein S18 acetylase RimI-like enzyme
LAEAPAISLALRPVREDDLEFLHLLYATTREDELAQVPWTPEQRTAFLRMQSEAQHRWYQERYAGAEFSILEIDGQPVGRLYIARWENEIRLIDIALMPEVRGRGIGSSLLREILEEGRKRRMPVTIHVEKNNPALRLYERLGFHAVEDRGFHWFMEWRPEGADQPNAASYLMPSASEPTGTMNRSKEPSAAC